MRSRTLSIAALSLVSILGLSACGSSSPKSTDTTVAGATGSEPVPVSDVAPSSEAAPVSEAAPSSESAPASEAATTLASGGSSETTLPAGGAETTIKSGGDAATTVAGAPAGELKDIVDTAVGAGNFTTLAKLLTDAGLIDTLKGAGPFTVFAPTDEAFAKVPKETLDKLGKDKEMLKKVLTYHVVAGKVLAADVKPGDVPTVAGPTIKITVDGGKVKVNDANVTATDIMASNGVIHVIDSVLLPPA
jgi:uncharacterized surface protein with fasciclin (FAS1) repeats